MLPMYPSLYSLLGNLLPKSDLANPSTSPSIGADPIRDRMQQINQFMSRTYAPGMYGTIGVQEYGTVGAQNPLFPANQRPPASGLVPGPAVGSGSKAQGEFVAALQRKAQALRNKPTAPIGPIVGKGGGKKTTEDQDANTNPTGPTGYTQKTELPFAFSTQEELRQKALAGLQGDIESARQEFATTLAAQRAENKANREILARYGQAVNAYLADAATRAGRDFETQAATQAILGAVGQGALQNRPMGTIFASPRPELGNAPLMTALGAQQAEQGAAIGATLNQLLGTDAASRLLSEARGAQQSALASAAGEGATGQRLLSGLLKTQGATISDLLSKKQQFEAKVPSLIAKRMQDLADAELQNYFKSQALGIQQGNLAIAQKREGRLAAQAIAAEARRSKLTPAQIIKADKEASDLARDLAAGRSTDTIKIQGGKQIVTGRTITKQPAANYQQAYKQLMNSSSYLTPENAIRLLNSQPRWSQPGVNGRPYLSIVEREYIKNNYQLSPEQIKLVDDAAFNPESARQILSAIGR